MKFANLSRRILCSLLLTTVSVRAHLPPTAEQIEELRRKGQLDSAIAFTEQLENDRFSEHVAARAHSKLMRAQLKAQGYSDAEIDVLAPQPAPPPDWRGLPTSGQPRSLTILVDFNDYRAATEHPNISVAEIDANIYGDGTATGQTHRPFDSASAYWKRASQNQLDIKGTVLGWRNLPGNRANYEPPANADNTTKNQANFDLVKTVLQHYDATHDFSQYDNDNDGFIEGINVIWTGPTGAWASFWWGYRWRFFINDANNITFDGKKLTWFTWQKLEPRDANSDFDPTTLIHETGHLIGLPDLYDYKPDQGNQGGVGGFDVMHGNIANPNGFLRWMMDWITPEVVSAGSVSEHTLRASGDLSSNTNKAVVIFPGATNNYFREFFLIENRHRVGNDAGESNLPSDGLAIWHVDSALNPDGNNFAMSNTDSPNITAHKLVRLVQADGLAQIENNAARVDAGDYYTSGKTFTPASTPPSHGYNGQNINVPTDISVTDISASGVVMTAKIGFGSVNQQPDLVDAGTNLHGVTPASRTPGQTFNVTGSVRNSGTAAAAAYRVAYYASTNAGIDTNDTLLGTRDMGGLNANATAAIDTTLTVPAGMGQGTYFIGWIIDSLGAVGEANEQNNNVSIAAPNLTVTGANMPELRVVGNGFDINNGDTTPLADNGTDFGSTAVNVEVQRTFSLQNTGTASLTVGAVTFTGDGSFRVVTAPAGTIAAGGTSSLVLGFLPTSGGLKSAGVQIVNSDNDENPFGFSIKGGGLAADDHGGNTGTATVVAAPSTTAGSIDNAGDEDFFRINVPATGLLRVFTIGNIDTFGSLLGSAGNQLLADDDSGAGTNFNLELQVTTGTYYVKVTGYDATVTGAYSLNVEFNAGASGDDHSNTRAGATVLGTDGSSASNLEQGGDIDYFSVTTTQPGYLYIWTTGITDTFAMSEDAGGTAFAQDDDGGGDRNCYLALALNPGTYYIRLTGYGPDTVGAYTINSSFVVAAAGDDHGDSPATATIILNNSFTDGIIHSAADVDYFLIYVPVPGYLAAFTTGTEDTLGLITDVGGNPGVNELAPAVDDGGPDLNFGFLIGVPAGYYYIRVRGFDGNAVGPYQLETSFTPGAPGDDYDDVPNESIGSLNPAGGNLNGALEAPGDQDCFRISFAAAGLFTVESTGGTDTFLTLRNVSGQPLATADDQGANVNFKLVRFLQPGQYFVHVRGFNFTAFGAYSLQWSFAAGPAPDDHGDNTGAATAITRNSTTAGTMLVGGDEDFFRFDLTENSNVAIYTTGDTDPFGHLLNASGNELASDDDTGGALYNFRIVTVLPAGTYYVRVRGYDAGVTGDYTLHIESTPAPVSGAFLITGATRSANGQSLDLTWASQPGSIYRIETTLDVTTGPWTVAANNIAGGAGATTSTTINLTPAERKRFFRVVRQ